MMNRDYVETVRLILRVMPLVFSTEVFAMKGGTAVAVRIDGKTVGVPVPDLLGAVVLKSVAWAVHSHDRARHSQDAAFLVSLMSDRRSEKRILINPWVG